MKKWIFLLVVLTNAIQTVQAAEQQNHNPKVGLVLSGGGARCAAHIGVIEALEEMNVPIDFIVGTSVGAVIGGLYASGVPIEKLKHDFSTLDWNDIFSYNINRTDLYYRRKLDNDIFLTKNFISYSGGQFHIPYGIITGQTLYEVFNTYLLPLQPIHDFKCLNIPFKAVATDLVTGNVVVLDQGDMALALLASMAVPGIISPIDQNGYMLVDGGVSANVPIQLAKSMGADILIVVDVSTPLAVKDEIVDLAGVIDQLSNIMTSRNEQISKAFLTSTDILIEPQLGDIGTSDFDNFAQGIEPGRLATEKLATRLRPLASNLKCLVPAVQSHVAFNSIGLKDPVVMDDETYLDYVSFQSPMTPKEINHQIEMLYGLSFFDRINYGVEEIRNERMLVIEPKVDQANPIFFQGSLLIDTDFDMTNTFGLVLGITNARANSYLGEWRLLGQIGQGESLVAEFYQPLSKNLTWFVNPRVSVQRTPGLFYYDFDAIAELVSTSDKVGILFGRNFGQWGRLSGFWQYEYNDLKQETGCFSLVENQYVSNGAVGLLFEWDTLDNLYFPHQGVKGKIILSNFDEAYGGDSHFSQLTIKNIAAVSKGKHALALGTTYNRTIEDTPTFPAKYVLGGLFELTGLSNNELMGDQSALGTAVYFYEFKKIELVPNRPMMVYLGSSFEAGKVWGDANVSNERWIGSGSIFLAADTLIGPFYLAVGITDNGHRAIHLALRPAFK